MIYADLVLNLSLLIALSVVSGFIEQRRPGRTRTGALLQGLLFGIVAVIGMLRPLDLGGGLIFDGRSVMLSLCALFFGPVAAGTAGFIAAAFRIAMGGMGALMGVLVIASAIGIGLAARLYSRPEVRPPRARELYVFGIAVHLAMLAMAFSMPLETALGTLRQIGLPVLILYPLATVLAGQILSERFAMIRQVSDLEKTTENLAVTLNAIGDAVISTDETGRVSLLNPMAETLTGWSKNAAQDQPLETVFSIVNAHTGEPVETPVRKVIASGKVEGLANHTVLISKDGERRQIADSAAPIRSGDGTVRGVVLVFRDVTEEYKAREEWLRQERMLRIAGRVAKLGGWYVDLSTRDVWWSDETAEIHGMPPGYSPGLDQAIGFCAPEYRERIREIFSACADQGIPYDEIMQIINASGERVWVRAIGEPIYDESTGEESTGPDASTSRRITAVQGAFQDITNQKMVSEALAESEREYRKLFEDHAAVKLIIDPDTGRIVDANHAAAAFYGWSREEIMRMKIQQINTLSAEAVKQEMERARKLQKVSFEFRHRLADGSVRDVAVFSSNIHIKGREYLHSIVHDITDQKNLQAQLEQSQKLESVGRLAGGVAHDFNNMLSIIIGNADMALENQDGRASDIRDNLLEIRRAGKRSADLTRQLLAFARKQTIAPVVIDLNETIDGMLQMLHRLIGEDITLHWFPSEETWPVKMDPVQVDQVLVNLVVNARDAIDGVGRLTIETGNRIFDEAYCRDHPDFQPGRYAMLAVSDDGCGMDAETLRHIFEPFFTAKEKGRGSGLGLSTVYGIVRQNSGFINVYSEPVSGSTFRIYLPAEEGAAAERVTPVQKTIPTGTETILMVEDEPHLLDMGKIMLEQLGYTVIAAAMPGEAIRAAQTHAGSIDLLITDVVMPEMNGLELFRRIGELRDIRCIFVSGYTADVIAHHGVLDEGFHFIQKPFSRKDLAVKVRRVLDNHDG